MEDSSSSSNCPDLEHCTSESRSNQSLSVGYFPSEDSTECEDIMPCEDLASEASSSLFLPPVQGAQETKSVRRPMRIRNQIQEKPGELGEAALMEIVYAYLSCLREDALANWGLSEDYQRMDKSQQERIDQNLLELDELMKYIKAFLDNSKDDKDHEPVVSDSPQEEDLQPSSSVSPSMDQVSHQEEETGEDLPKCKPPENGDIMQFPEMPVGLEDDEIVEMESQDTGTAESSAVAAEQSEEEDVPSDKESTCCVNFGGFFHWLRKRVVSSLPGRKRRERPNKVPFCWH